MRRGRLLSTYSTTHIAHTCRNMSLSCSRFFCRSLFAASVMIRLRSRFATRMSDTPRVSSVICSGFPLEVGLTFLKGVGFQVVFVASPLSISFPFARRKAFSSCFGSRVSGTRITCPAQSSCDLEMYASINASCFCLFEDASVGYHNFCQWTRMYVLIVRLRNC